MSKNWPSLPLAEWRDTRDHLQSIAQVLSALRGSLAPRRRHWGHYSVYLTPRGFSTGLISADDGFFELIVDLECHEAILSLAGEHVLRFPLTATSAADLAVWLKEKLQIAGIAWQQEEVFRETPLRTDQWQYAGQWHQAALRIESVLARFKAQQRWETSAVQLWPHHFDMAMLLFSGRLVPDTDPADENVSDEQMNFGFVTGDEGIENAYFYITAYPTPDRFTEGELPAGAYWHTEGWKGAILPYAELISVEDPDNLLLEFFRSVHAWVDSIRQ